MIARINLGAAPRDEACAQVGTSDYDLRAMAECQDYIALIRETLGREPESGDCGLHIMARLHDYGTYLEVDLVYDDEDMAAAAYAYRVETERPRRWSW